VPFAWFVWERDYRGPLIVYRISHKTGTRTRREKSSSTKENRMSKKTADAQPDLKLVDGEEQRLSGADPTPLQKPAEINPFDLASLVVQPAYKEPTGMVASATTLPVQDKAGPQTFFMAHPDPGYAQILHVVKMARERRGFTG
jgi:hypothetical protein